MAATPSEGSRIFAYRSKTKLCILSRDLTDRALKPLFLPLVYCSKTNLCHRGKNVLAKFL